MPTYQIMPLVLAALLVTLTAGSFLASLRLDLARLLFWALLGTTAALLSLVSLLHGKSGHAGTGSIVRYGWPKPFYFITHPEIGGAIQGWSFIYFIGNASVYGAVLLLAWTAWRAIRR